MRYPGIYLIHHEAMHVQHHGNETSEVAFDSLPLWAGARLAPASSLLFSLYLNLSLSPSSVANPQIHYYILALPVMYAPHNGTNLPPARRAGAGWPGCRAAATQAPSVEYSAPDELQTGGV